MRGHDLVPKDSNGLSDPYILVKYGSQIMFRSKVIKKSLNPEWNERVTLTAPSTDDIIYVVSYMQRTFAIELSEIRTISVLRIIVSPLR